MISHAAARRVAREILEAVCADVDPLEVSLAASLIVLAVEMDELEEVKHRLDKLDKADQ